MRIFHYNESSTNDSLVLNMNAGNGLPCLPQLRWNLRRRVSNSCKRERDCFCRSIVRECSMLRRHDGCGWPRECARRGLDIAGGCAMIHECEKCIAYMSTMINE